MRSRITENPHYVLVVIEDTRYIMAEIKFSDVFKGMNLAFGIEPCGDKGTDEKEIVDYTTFCDELDDGDFNPDLEIPNFVDEECV